MKIKKILSSLALASITTLSITPAISCSNDKYSDLVKTVVNKLVEMDRYPRCTSVGERANLDAIRVWIIKEAINSGVSYTNIHSDGYGNIWFDVDASTGYENYKMLILQGHMDMVVAGLTDETKATTPIDVEVEWDKGIVHSKDYKTSLGADDGVALAIIFTLLQDPSFKHGPLRIILTADEDSGMIGAAYISQVAPYILQKTKSISEGEDIEYLLNIDAEGLGEVYRSCFGSETYTFSNSSIEPGETSETAFTNKLSLEVKGLKGGHSGDINKKMASAEKCIYEILNEIEKSSIQISKHYHPDPDNPEKDISFQRNQIVPHAKVLFNSKVTKDKIQAVINSKITKWKQIYTIEDWDKVSITIENSTDSAHEHFLSSTDSNTVITKLGNNADPTKLTKDGSLWYGSEVTSEGKIVKSANISPVEIEYSTNKFSINFVSQFRTSTNGILTEMDEYYKTIDIFGLGSVGSYYPAWEYNETKENKMLSMASEAFKKQSIEPKIIDSNGGMENSYWANINPNLHLTGIGPTITDAHSVKETLYIDTIEPVINVVKYVCEQMKK